MTALTVRSIEPRQLSDRPQDTWFAVRFVESRAIIEGFADTSGFPFDRVHAGSVVEFDVSPDDDDYVNVPLTHAVIDGLQWLADR